MNKPWKGNRRQAEKRGMTTFNKVIEQRDIQGTANKEMCSFFWLCFIVDIICSHSIKFCLVEEFVYS